jgi:hypothetical protein
MPLPEFVVAIWVKPHHGYGYYVEVDASNLEDGLPGGVFQSFEHVTLSQRVPEFQPDYPHREFAVSAPQIRELVQLADRATYSLAERPHTPMLRGSFFGLRVERGFQEATIVWHGKFEEQEGTICNLYAAVQSLAEA